LGIGIWGLGFGDWDLGGDVWEAQNSLFSFLVLNSGIFTMLFTSLQSVCWVPQDNEIEL